MKRTNGQTLLEILLYVSVFSILITVIIFVFLNIFYSINKNQAISETNEQGEYLLNIITKNINNSTAINTPTSGVSSDNISLVKSNITLNPTLVYFQGGDLYIKEGSNSAVKLNNSKTKIDSIQFLNISNSSSESPSLKIMIIVSYNSSGFGNEIKYSTNFYTTANVR